MTSDITTGMKQNLPCALELRNQKQFIMEGKLSFELMEVNRNLKQRETIYHLSLAFKKWFMIETKALL